MPLLLAWLIHGLVIAALVRGTLRLAGSATAATRYAVCWAGLVIVLALPLALLMPALAMTRLQWFAQDTNGGPAVAVNRVTLGDATAASATHVATPMPSRPDTLAAVSASASGSTPAADSLERDSLESASSAAAGALSASEPPPLLRLPRIPDWIIAIAIGLWLGFVSLGLLRIAQALEAMQRMKAASRPFPGARARRLAGWRAARRHGRLVELRLCDEVVSASFLGLTRPVIAISPALAASLTDEELDLTVMHEFAHAQRFDDWTKLAQLVVMACCGWHPAVRLLDRAIDLERESACDDWVVRRSGSARGYARCLVKIVQTMPAAAEVLVPGAYASESVMETRVKRLLDKNCRHDAWAPFSTMATACGAALLAFVLTQVAPMRALAGHVVAGEAGASLAATMVGGTSPAAWPGGRRSLASVDAIASTRTAPAGARAAAIFASNVAGLEKPASRTPAPVAFPPALLTTAAMTPTAAPLDVARLASRMEPIAPPVVLTSALPVPAGEWTAPRDAANDLPTDAPSTAEAGDAEDLRGAGRVTLGALDSGTRKLGSAGAATGEGLAQAGAAAGGGIIDAGSATGAGFTQAGVAAGHGLNQAGRATGDSLASAGLATGQAAATAAQKTGNSLKKSGVETGRALAKVRNAFKIF